jgi:hypothetical protein
MNACKRGCTQVEEFLQDECVALRNAFGYVYFKIRSFMLIWMVSFLLESISLFLDDFGNNWFKENWMFCES